MEDIRKYVGQRIRLLRKQRQMTTQMLADKIGKSRSMISKYESGMISIDIVTLEQIAEALGYSLNAMIDYPAERKTEENVKNHLFDQRELFLYYYDGRREEIMKSYLLVAREGEPNKVEYYLGVSEFEDFGQSDFIYKGKMYSYDLVTHFSLVNQTNPVDKLSICVLNPLHRNNVTWGILVALLSNPIAPYAVKVLVARQMLSDKEISKEKIIFSKEELKRIQKYNMLYTDNNQK